MKFSILVGGSHRATVTTDLDGQGAFTGSIESPEFGQSEIRDGTQDGDHLKGAVTMAGREAEFSADVTGGSIRGTLRIGWFFRMDFNGVECPPISSPSPSGI